MKGVNGVDGFSLPLYLLSTLAVVACAGLFAHPFEDLRLELSGYAARE